jgi:imidazole glycerol-phosphate synthase subunit HisH
MNRFSDSNHQPLVHVVDLGISNIRSVLQAFARVGAHVRQLTDATELDEARAVVLPGVGAFNDGMARLESLGLIDRIRRHALERRRPLLGICLGMQLLADESEEHGRHEGLGILPGRVRRLAPTSPGHRVPNMGWCDVSPLRRCDALFPAAVGPRSFYFAHSYHLECADPEDVVATLDYGAPVAAIVARGSSLGVQFHPEKSQDAGLDLLEAFALWISRSGAEDARS